jgi:CheY-like chemotaxis protein
MILLDYELPEMDGLEVIGALRARPETRDIPVLLCTASKIGVGDIRKADGFLAKPFQEDLLYAVVQRIIGVDRASRQT